jgi:hypothetical protein
MTEKWRGFEMLYSIWFTWQAARSIQIPLQDTYKLKEHEEHLRDHNFSRQQVPLTWPVHELEGHLSYKGILIISCWNLSTLCEKWGLWWGRRGQPIACLWQWYDDHIYVWQTQEHENAWLDVRHNLLAVNSRIQSSIQTTNLELLKLYTTKQLKTKQYRAMNCPIWCDLIVRNQPKRYLKMY